jgi:hypothetical protein
MSYDEVANKHGTDKALGVGYGHGYMGYYEKLLEGRELRNILEIGVWRGGSLRMWAELFPGAMIYGIDTIKECKRFEGGRILVETVDSGDIGRLGEYASRAPEFDLIIDDGGHIEREVGVALVILWRKLVVGGIYVIEDVECKEFIDLGKWGGFLGNIRDWAKKKGARLEVYGDRIALMKGFGYSLIVLRKENVDTI